MIDDKKNKINPSAIIQNQQVGDINISGSGNTVFVQQEAKSLNAKLAIKEQIEELLEGMRDIKNSIESQQYSVQREIRKAERDNTGLRFEARTTASGTTYTISAKPGSGSTFIGGLSFPVGTEAGKRGLQKFQESLGKGLPIHFDPEECKFESALNLPWMKSLVDAKFSISLFPIQKSVKVPVRISCRTTLGLNSRVGLTYLETLRAGRKEIELKISGGQLAGSIFILLSRLDYDNNHKKQTVNCSVRVDLDWTSLTPEAALRTSNLFLAASRAPINVVSLQNEKKLLSPKLSSALPPESLLEAVKEILTNLIIINKFCASSLRFPEKISMSECRNIVIFSQLLRRKKLSLSVLSGSVAFVLLRKDVAQLIVHWHEHPTSPIDFVVHIANYRPTVLEREIFIGDLTVHVRKAMPDFDIDEFNESNSVELEPTVEVKFFCVELYHELKRS